MKKLFTFLFIAFFTLSIIAQVPEKMSYQGIVRNSTNQLVTNSQVGVLISVLKNTTPIFVETHTVITNSNGLISLEIGNGSRISGSPFSEIDWSDGTYFIKTEIDPSGGFSYTISGTSQLLSVPYAFQTKNLDGISSKSGNFGLGIKDPLAKFDINNTEDKDAFKINFDNILSSASALKINYNGNTSGVQIVNNSSDATTNSLRIEDNNSSNTGSTLYNLSHSNGAALNSINMNLGYAGLFQTDKASNDKATVVAINNGLSNAGYFINNNTSAEMASLAARSYSKGGALYCISNGEGPVGGFEVVNVNNPSTAFNINNNGLGSAIWIGQKNSNAASAIHIDYSGSSAVVDLVNKSTAAGNHILRLNDNNPNNVWSSVHIESLAPSPGLWIKNTNSLGKAAYFEGNVIINGRLPSPSLSITNTNSLGSAAYFDGNVTINGKLNVIGQLSKGGGTFKIDHPLDPKNKFLVHSFVESPEMMNIYSGNTITDEKGYATVELPSYFEAANKDFRYQLTVIGSFAQSMIHKEVSNNSFVIRTSQPEIKVSWQVTGVRNDNYAKMNPIEVEPTKDEKDKGTYLHPEVYGENKK